MTNSLRDSPTPAAFEPTPRQLEILERALDLVQETGLANLTLKVGTHSVVLRHPTLGEQQQTVVVKAVTPARLGVNLSR